MIILQNKFHLFFKPKAFWMLHLNDHLYSKSCVFLWVANFRGLIAGFASLPTFSRAFTVGHICITKTNGAFTRGGCLSLLANTRHIFSFFVSILIVRPCWTLSHHIEPTQSNTKHIVDYNHALTPISCNVLVYMQCDVPFLAYTMSHI